MRTSPTAFTVLELLIVVTIIGLLGGLSAAAAIALSARGDRLATQALLDGLHTALSSYVVECGVPTPRNGDLRLDGDPLLNELLERRLIQISRQTDLDAKGRLHDAWGQPIALWRGGDHTIDGRPLSTIHADQSEWMVINPSAPASHRLYLWSYGPDGPGADPAAWLVVHRDRTP